MANRESPLNYTSASFEKAAIARFRSLVTCVPRASKIFREPWDCSTVLCIDFENCPNLLPTTKAKAHILVDAVQQLGLASGIIFRIGKKTIGWEKIDSLENEAF
ncbi:MAG: hypothetical protein ACRC2R_25135 [Xenococcaceae cyanobacterium]